MSKNNDNITEEKVLTKYDQKIKKREAAKKQDKKDQKLSTLLGVAVLLVIVCFVASFPIRSYMTLNETFVMIGDTKVTKTEFEYSYNTILNNYVNTYGEYLNYFGMDITQDLATQQYDGDTSWKDYFQEMTADNIVRSKALLKEAKAANFSYDTTAEYEQFLETAKSDAKVMGVNLAEYIKRTYGELATVKRIEPFVKEALYVAAYYEKVTEDTLPTEAEIQAVYDANPEDYDSIDYRITEIEAELPTEPTDLADDKEAAADPDAAYQPSEAEIEKAMKDAKILADAAEKVVAAEGELKENVRKESVVYMLRDWLFDNARQAGDTTIIENNNSNKYYVLAFENRYLDNTPSVDVRVLMTTQDPQTMMNEWESGAATEESFAQMCDKYSIDKTAEGGLYEGNVRDGVSDALTDWMFAEERKYGDVEIIPRDETTSYIVYFVKEGRTEWQINIENSLSMERMSDYVEKISEGIQITDPSGNLPYLKIRAAQAAAE